MARKPYEVGYAKPPRKHQFPKGKSGNPKGRPKGSPNFRVAIRRQLAKTAVVSEGGRRRNLTKMDIGATQLANKIAAGDLRALMVALSVPGLLDGDEQKPQVLVNEDDKKVALAILARIQKAFGGGTGSGGGS